MNLIRANNQKYVKKLNTNVHTVEEYVDHINPNQF